MDYSVNYYLDDEDNLYASLLEDERYPTIFKDNKWNLCNLTFKELSEKVNLKAISEYDAFIIYFGVDVKVLYQKLGFNFKEEITIITDHLKHFFDSFIDFVVDDYSKHHHNKNQDLKYSLKELDIHYENAGYLCFMNDYYEEYLKRKEEFKDIKIIKKEDDYLIEFTNNILKVKKKEV